MIKFLEWLNLFESESVIRKIQQNFDENFVIVPMDEHQAKGAVESWLRGLRKQLSGIKREAGNIYSFTFDDNEGSHVNYIVKATWGKEPVKQIYDESGKLITSI